MPKKNILFISHRGVIGGGELSLFDLIVNLQKKTDINAFIILGERGELYEKFVDAGFIPIIAAMPSIKKLSIKTIFNIFRFVKKNQISVIHCNTTRSVFYALFAKLLLNPKLIWHNRGTDKRTIIEYALSFFADKLIAISATVANQLLLLGVNPKKILKIYNGFDLEANKEIINQPLKKHFKENNRSLFYICLAGRFTAEKGHFQIIEVMRYLIFEKKQTNVRCIFVGNSAFGVDILENIKNKIVEYNLTKYIDIRGFENNLPLFFYNNIDAVVIPSQREAFGRIVLESWAAGIPVIANNIEGLAEIIDHQKNGILVNKNDILEFSENILTLMQTPEFYNNLQTNGRLKLQEFSIDKTVEKIYAVF